MFDMPESTYYYHKQQDNLPNKDQWLEDKITEIFHDHKGTYGYRRITAELRNEGYFINHKRVQRLMNKLNLRCVKYWRKSRKYSSYKGQVGKTAPNRINRRFDTPVPLQKITTDVSEFKCYDGTKLYLSTFIDLYNREVLAYKISPHPTLDIAIDPLKEVIDLVNNYAQYRTTFHSDQGWQYQHSMYVHFIKENRCFQSMSRKGNCHDNSPMENFFGLLKQEIYYGHALVSYNELKKRIERWINYYNNERLKLKLGGLSPIQFRLKNAS